MGDTACFRLQVLVKGQLDAAFQVEALTAEELRTLRYDWPVLTDTGFLKVRANSSQQ